MRGSPGPEPGGLCTMSVHRCLAEGHGSPCCHTRRKGQMGTHVAPRQLPPTSVAKLTKFWTLDPGIARGKGVWICRGGPGSAVILSAVMVRRVSVAARDASTDRRYSWQLTVDGSAPRPGPSRS